MSTKYIIHIKDKTNLEIFTNTIITISAPINLTKEETSLYESVIEQGYDIFDGNISFYQDFSSSYTSENGTDVIIADRKSYYFNEDIISILNNKIKSYKIECIFFILKEVRILIFQGKIL